MHHTIDSLYKSLSYVGSDFVNELKDYQHVVKVPPKTELIREGQPVKFIPIILDGLVKVYTMNDDKELLYYYIKPGESCIMTFSTLFKDTISQGLGSHGALRDYATLTKTLGTQEVDPAERFGIYPNPAKEQLAIKNYKEVKSISVIDQNGRILSEFKNSMGKINLTQLKPGVYFREIKDLNDTMSYHKFIKN